MTRKDNCSGVENLINRYDRKSASPLWNKKTPKRICSTCRFVCAGSSEICPTCGMNSMAHLDYWGIARPPKKTASKKKWRKFFKQFKQVALK